MLQVFERAEDMVQQLEAELNVVKNEKKVLEC